MNLDDASSVRPMKEPVSFERKQVMEREQAERIDVLRFVNSSPVTDPAAIAITAIREDLDGQSATMTLRDSGIEVSVNGGRSRVYNFNKMDPVNLEEVQRLFPHKSIIAGHKEGENYVPNGMRPCNEDASRERLSEMVRASAKSR